jgi:putative tricarboxylic transport membrane protein
MIPLLTLGIPFFVPAAIMLAGLRMHNVEPGPLLFTTKPEIFWTFIAAMYIGNTMLLILNLPLVGIFAKVAQIHPKWLMPFIGVICLVGVYSSRNSMFDIWVMVIAGFVGFFLRTRWKFPVASFIIGLVLGPMTENSMRQTLKMFEGDLSLISDRPIAVTFLAVTLIFILFRILFPLLRQKLAVKR